MYHWMENTPEEVERRRAEAERAEAEAQKMRDRMSGFRFAEEEEGGEEDFAWGDKKAKERKRRESEERRENRMTPAQWVRELAETLYFAEWKTPAAPSGYAKPQAIVLRKKKAVSSKFTYYKVQGHHVMKVWIDHSGSNVQLPNLTHSGRDVLFARIPFRTSSEIFSVPAMRNLWFRRGKIGQI
jgi:hypothetical protein